MGPMGPMVPAGMPHAGMMGAHPMNMPHPGPPGPGPAMPMPGMSLQVKIIHKKTYKHLCDLFYEYFFLWNSNNNNI